MKFVLAFLVVAIHVAPINGTVYDGWIMMLCRLAVPLFFITSGFLFFGKMREESDQRKRLTNFLKRGFLLYFSWLVILLPITVYRRGWFELGLFGGLWTFLRSFFLGSTFAASWYLMALLIGTLLIAVSAKVLSNRVLLAIGFAVYLLCCAYSGYGNLTGLPTSDWYAIYLSFPVSFIWLTIGKMIAEGEIALPKRGRAALLIGAAALYAIEFQLCRVRRWAAGTDAFVFLIPICTVVFLIVKEGTIETPRAKTLRNISTVTYCAHANVAFLFTKGAERLFKLDFDSGAACLLRYAVTVLVCFGLGLLLQALGKRWKPARWLY